VKAFAASQRRKPPAGAPEGRALTPESQIPQRKKRQRNGKESVRCRALAVLCHLMCDRSLAT
jgi:hypothetical protein